MDLVYKLDVFHLSIPVTYIPQPTIFLGRTISWINEIYNYAKFSLLIPLYLDPTFKSFDEGYIPTQLETSINYMFISALAFVKYCGYQVNPDQTFVYLSKTWFVSGLAHCILPNPQLRVVEVFVEGMRLTGFPQEDGILYESVVEREKAVKALEDVLLL